MFRVLADGEERHRLEQTDGTVVGWVHGRTIAFIGFDDDAHAIDAAAVAWRALDRVLRREFAGWPRHEPAYDRLRIVGDGAGEWIGDGTWSLARVLRVDDGARDGAPLALEFQLPSFAQEGVAIAAAQLMGVALAGMIGVGARASPGGHDAPARGATASGAECR